MAPKGRRHGDGAEMEGLKKALADSERRAKANLAKTVKRYSVADLERFAAQRGLTLSPLAGRLECPDCGRSFTSTNAFFEHAQRRHPERPLAALGRATCPVCPRSFTNAEAFHRHMLRHPEQPKAPARPACTICNRRFATWSHLGEHASTRHPSSFLAPRSVLPEPPPETGRRWNSWRSRPRRSGNA